MLRSGFFNSFYANGEYDRKYNADDYSANMGAIIRSGVLRDANNGFRVTASGLALSVSPGRAWLEGRWAHLDTVHTFPNIVPPVGDLPRVDGVYLQLDTSINARQISFVYKQGTPATTPSAPPVVREGDIFEICLAHIWVNPNASSVTATDCRPDMELCGWVTSPIGYEDYFANLDAVFNEWLAEKRETLAVNTLFKQYMWRTVLESASSSVAFDIPQHNGTGVDIIHVYVNGLLEIEGVDYTLSGSVITFHPGGGATGTKVAGTEIVVICYKSIDGTGLGSVADEVTELQNKVAALGDITEYNYICTGLDDNVKLSQIAQTFLAGSTSDNKKMTIRVYGTLGVTSAFGGTGALTSPYQWFKFGTDASTSRKVIFDFENCSRIDIAVPDGTSNIIFYGYNMHIRNANVIVSANSPDTVAVAFNCKGRVLVEDCSVRIEGNNGCYIASSGDFVRCNFNVRNYGGASACFKPTTDSLLRVTDCECYAYAVTGANGMVVYVEAAATGACVIVNGMSCPTFAVSGTAQTHAIFDASQNGCCAYNNIITTQAVNAPGQSVVGTLKVNKYNRV